ncbi:MAG TPA: hypothetical protein DEV68_04460 [Corynebacterium flavescens]|nr:excalibur calcium-binding domain-containing protein [Corynebacterium flavescens]HCG46229.1 hypothetical protein [Corynebacterium flavescens]
MVGKLHLSQHGRVLPHQRPLAAIDTPLFLSTTSAPSYSPGTLAKVLKLDHPLRKAFGMKSRLSIFCLISAVAVSLTACGSADESEPSTSTTETSTTSSSKSSTIKTTSSSVASSTSSEPAAEPEPTINEDADTQIHGFLAPQEQQPDPVAPAPDPAPVVEEQAPAPAPAPAPVYEAPAPAPAPAPAASYANCSQVKAAGAAPLYAGSPGYSTSLDRDGDGVACEK